MIYEFALDPELVARWHDPKEWAIFREGFAPETGRVGSAYPRKPKWRKAIVKAFHTAMPNANEDSQSRRRLEVLLDRLAERMVERESSHPELPNWLDRALAEHRERPFHGILSLGGNNSSPEVITPDMLFSEQPPTAWAVPPNPTPPRTPQGLAQAVAPLLTRCGEVVFVDPWFDPSPLSGQRYLDSLKAMFAVMWGDKRCGSAPEAQLVTAEGGKRGGPGLLAQCQRELPSIIPKGQRLLVTVLRQRAAGEKTHNRYILTKLAGVTFGVGLDAAKPEDHASTDDLCRLSSEQLIKRWGQYVSARTSWFDVAAGPLEILSAG